MCSARTREPQRSDAYALGAGLAPERDIAEGSGSAGQGGAVWCEHRPRWQLPGLLGSSLCRLQQTLVLHFGLRPNTSLSKRLPYSMLEQRCKGGSGGRSRSALYALGRCRCPRRGRTRSESAQQWTEVSALRSSLCQAPVGQQTWARDGCRGAQEGTKQRQIPFCYPFLSLHYKQYKEEQVCTTRSSPLFSQYRHSRILQRLAYPVTIVPWIVTIAVAGARPGGGTTSGCFASWLRLIYGWNLVFFVSFSAFVSHWLH